MAKPLRVLFVEDREKDVELLMLELQRGGYDLVQERVDTPEAFASALDRQGWDIILCDYRMPRFSAVAALALFKEKKVDLPFIVVSGTVGEETAVEALRGGAHDFMTKDKLSRLLPAIDRELREAGGRAERRRAESALREKDAQYRQMVESVRAVVWRADPRTFQYTFVSPEAEKALGYPLRTWLEEPFFLSDHLHPDDREWVMALCRKNTDEKRDHQFEYRMVAADGRTVWFRDLVRVVVEGDETRELVGVMIDVTERRHLEEKYRGIFENAVVGIYQTTLEGRYVAANPTLARIYGYASPEELMAAVADLNRRFYVQPGRREEFIRLVNERGGVHEFESQVFRKDGSVIWISEEARAVRDAGGRLVGFEGTTVDVTARKLAEQERERLVAILEATPDFVGISDPRARVLYVNAGGRKLLELGVQDDPSGFSVADFYPESARKRVLETALPAAARDGIWRGETTLLARDGREVDVSQVILAHKGADGQVTFFSTIARDLSEQKRLEAQFRQVQKMEAIGQLAGGVAHDFNNILGVVTGYAEILLQRLPQGDPLCRHAREIEKAAQRAAGLTRQLLAFSRKQALEPRPLDLNATVEGMEGMLRRLIGEDIDLVTVLAPDLLPVVADPGQIEQVLLNLAGNARDAMPKGGRLTIETAEVYLGEAYARDHLDVRSGPYTMLAVSDTGMGMDEATRARIFEPFFTTKGPGKGTGLGLATVYGVVKQSGGHVSVYSEPGRGTTFKVYLPQVPETAAAPAAEPVGAPAEAPGGAETILVAEDEEALRGMILEVLEDMGYTVLMASDGSDALAVAEAHAGPIHLLLTDVVMPRLSGRELFERLGALRPGLRCVFMSGYTGHAALRNGTLPQGQGLLEKPFTPAGLLRKVRQRLDAP